MLCLQLLYLVCWTGYEGADERNFLDPRFRTRHASELVADFHLPIQPSLSSVKPLTFGTITLIEVLLSFHLL